MAQIVQRTNHLSPAVVRQESVKKILLVPELDFVHQLPCKVVARGEYIVDVNNNALPESGQQLEEFVVHIALRWNDARRIDEPDVVVLKCRKERHIDIVDFAAND